MRRVFMALYAILLVSAADAQTLSSTPETSPSSDFTDGQEFNDCSDAPWCPRMVVVPAGSFTMGSAANEPGRRADEGPQHPVSVERFAAGKFEITFDQWAACAADNACRRNPFPSDQGRGRGQQPVTNISWNDAQEYVAWLSRRTGHSYRLLTEAEWEYAARAGTQTRFWWGRNTTPRQAQYNWTYNGAPEFTAPGHTAPVGTFAANAFGLYDVHGNIAEWVSDCYHNSYADAPQLQDASCAAHVLRGGSWNDIVPELRSSERTMPAYGERRFWMWGLRVARDLTSSQSSPASPRVVWADAREVRVGQPHPIVMMLMTQRPRPPRGRADLDCTIAADWRAQCTLIRETPTGHNFGATALRVADIMRAEPYLSDGTTLSAGAHTQVSIYFPGADD